jgi:hypothetical protein
MPLLEFTVPLCPFESRLIKNIAKWITVEKTENSQDPVHGITYVFEQWK